MTEAGRDGKRCKVGLVLEPAGVEDPYGHGAYIGLERAVHELGVGSYCFQGCGAAGSPEAAAGAHPLLSPG